MKLQTSKVAAVVFAVVLSGTTYSALADNGASQRDGNEQSAQSQNKSAQQDQAPQNRFGKPDRTIGTDADQADYDRQDGGIPGVTVTGSRVFEARVTNGATRTGATNVNLVKHAGSPMATTKIYAIYWGSSFKNVAYASGVNAFLSSIVSSSNNLNKVTTQYMNAGVAANTSTFNPITLVDTSNPPSTAPTTASILTEAYKVANAAKIVPDANSLFMVFTNNYPTQANYCAWHGAGTVNGKQMTVAYQPYLGGVAGCPALTSTGSYATSTTGVDAVANVGSHEIYETITDPFLNAWYDNAGAEIGDKCAWTHGVAAVGGYYVQTEWSNKISNCAATA